MLSRLRRFMLTVEQEEGCRQFYLQADINQAKLGILIFAIPFIAFVYNDYRFSGFFVGVSWFGRAARSASCLDIIFEFIKLNKVKSYHSYDKIVFLGILVIMVGSGIINATRPQNFVVQIILTCISVFILYLVIPNRISYQFLLSSLTSIGESVIIVLVLTPSDVPALFTIFLSLFFANVIAFLSSWQIHSYRRKSYQDLVRRREMQETLEQHSKNLEALVAERTEKLKNAERLAAIGATAGMVGHDIRNPLTAITGAVYLAKKEMRQFPDSDSKEKLTKNLDLIREQTVYVNKIVEDLQDYARPLNPSIEETNLEQIVTSITTELKIPDNIAVAYLTEKDHSKLQTDSAYMKRILTNLVNNAVQAMPTGGKLTIRITRVNGKAQISVEDTGEGIPEEAKSRLFTPLMTTKSKGQGFGLAVVKRLTEALNGRVTYESEAGKGTKFIIELPLLS